VDYSFIHTTSQREGSCIDGCTKSSRGAVSLVSCTSWPGRAIISDDADVLQFLDDLAVVVAALEWRIYAWCILPDRCSVSCRPRMAISAKA